MASFPLIMEVDKQPPEELLPLNRSLITINAAFRDIISGSFKSPQWIYYSLQFKRPASVRSNFASPIDGKRG